VFTPKYPPPDTAPTAPVVPTAPAAAPAPLVPATEHTRAPAPAPVPVPGPVSARPVVQLTPGSTLALVAGGAGVVLVVGAVLVSMFLAVAVTSVSVAFCAVVLRSLLNQEGKH
jgi:hypothetical protein